MALQELGRTYGGVSGFQDFLLTRYPQTFPCRQPHRFRDGLRGSAVATEKVLERFAVGPGIPAGGGAKRCSGVRLTLGRAVRRPSGQCASPVCRRVSGHHPSPPSGMRQIAQVVPTLALVACATAGSGAAESTVTETLPSLARVTSVVITDGSTGKQLGSVLRGDSVAALASFYARLTNGWSEGRASSLEVGSTFYQGASPVAFLALGFGSFEARVGNRMLRRPAKPAEALEFVRLAGVPVKHLQHVLTTPLRADSLVVAQVWCPMPVLRPDTALLRSMPIAVTSVAGLEHMPAAPPGCRNSPLMRSSVTAPPHR